MLHLRCVGKGAGGEGKETYYRGKRDLRCVGKGAGGEAPRDLVSGEKRPTIEAKETCVALLGEGAGGEAPYAVSQFWRYPQPHQ